MMINRSEKLQIRDQEDYIHDLEEERRKIQVFQRELPLCLELITQAIETCKQQLSGKTTEFNLNGGQSECSEQTSNDVVPVFEEFIPIKKNDVSCNKDGKINGIIHNKNLKKSDWLKTAQLWNQTPDQPSKDDLPKKVSVVEVKSTISSSPTQVPEDKCVPPASTSSTVDTGGGGNENKEEEEKKEGRSQRKSRRCWSLELHERFLQALQQLGGSHVATPKQIREMMKIDGLTNDEVKSHLQVYLYFSIFQWFKNIDCTREDQIIQSTTTTTKTIHKHLTLWWLVEYGCHQNMLQWQLQPPRPWRLTVVQTLPEYTVQSLHGHHLSKENNIRYQT
ncbi:hypothetical protein ACJIZ3_020098 [Penstemon smallii]|uniref:HTH myb-type domain-containing protein n=1 Tax=Penstemon smallii TaxID=265156 RepID=A0ABD3SHS0_9LAMI